MFLKRYIIILFLLLSFREGSAQINLVQNPSFEDTLGNCQSLWIKDWKVFSNFSTPDYFNICVNSATSPPYVRTVPHNFRGYQYPRTGNGYLGLGLYFIMNPNDSSLIETECVTVKLKKPLIRVHSN